MSPHAVVEVATELACARCSAGKGCGAGLIGSNRGSRRVQASIDAGLSLREGDAVRLELRPSRLLHASLLVYGVPLCGALVGAAVAAVLGLAERAAVMTALGGLFVGLVVARLWLRRAGCLRQFRPRIVERLSVSN
ncbi:MAG: SoxR reducing system RseC family protein [Woeseiaceae bacterium]|nr:SoxR reducing system RseC family protein [Woeseiaceae bacterium]